MSSRTRLSIIGLGFMVVAVGCTAPPGVQQSSARSSEPQSMVPSTPKRLVAAMTADPPMLTRALGLESARGGDALQNLVQVGFSIEDEQATLHPRLAEALPSLENGLWKMFPDGRMETTFKIRDNAVWHDGVPATSEDVVFAVKIKQDRELPIRADAVFDLIEKVEAAAPRTAMVTWKRPYVLADALFGDELSAPALMPRHILEPAYSGDKARFTAHPYWTEEFVGTGPFKLDQWVRDSHLILRADDRYTLGRPKIDEIEVRFAGDSNALLASVLAGAVELTLGRIIALEQATQAAEQWRDGRLATNLAGWHAIYPQHLNPKPAVIADVQFRRALLHAIDRQALVDSFVPLSRVAHTYVSPNLPEFRSIESGIVKYAYDPTRAVQLIEGLGLTRGPDGIFQNGRGQRLWVEVRTGTEAGNLQQQTVFAVGDYWQRVGVSTQPVIDPPQRARDREYSATRPGFHLTRNDNVVHSLIRFHGSQTPLQENNFVGQNRNRYMNAEFDGLIDRYFSTIPKQDRIGVLRHIVNHMTDRVTNLDLFYDVEGALVTKRLLNVPFTRAWNVHEWDLQ